jgi:radical SAM protein with 4Fe4S-binding SPASM domain
MIRKRVLMSLDDWKKIIDNLDIPLKSIIVGLTGDALINPDVFKMIRYAADKGIKCSMPTNGLILDRFDPDEVLKSGMHKLNVAIDGATQNSYSEYRVGGNLNRVTEALRKVCLRKRELKLERPHIMIQFLVMKHNEHEIPKMIELAKYIQPDTLYFKAPAMWTSLTGDKREQQNREELAKKWLPTNKEFQRYDMNLEIEGAPNVCQFAFDNSVILWNGDVSLCCLDFEGHYKFGNLFEKPFKEIFRSEGYQKIRRQVVDKKLEICKGCDITNAVKTGRYINFTGEDLKESPGSSPLLSTEEVIAKSQPLTTDSDLITVDQIDVKS